MRQKSLKYICFYIYIISVDCFLNKYRTANGELDYCLTDRRSLSPLKLKGKADNRNGGMVFSSPMTTLAVDPALEAEKMINEIFFGKYSDVVNPTFKLKDVNETIDPMEHYPSGEIMHKENFGNKTTVFIPTKEFIYPGHCKLKITEDYMQTALNAIAIFSLGSVEDIHKLPSEYVLHSARTISMLKIYREKLTATWEVVKRGMAPKYMTFERLQLYRPLFKYVNAREMARLNLSDERIVSFIGTHPDLNRHQVTIVAKRYMKRNPAWPTPKYLSLMNNLLCGVPIIYLRNIDETVFLQMTEQALGKVNSWSARDVGRLGLLLAEVRGQDLSVINPQAMSAISAQVMREIPVENLRYITDVQVRYINHKSLNILAKKINMDKDKAIYNKTITNSPIHTIIIMIFVWNLF